MIPPDCRPTFKYRLSPAKLPKFDPAWKSKCLTCAAMHGPGEVMRCREVGIEPQGVRQHVHCCEARAHDGVCGPEARLWRSKP